MKSASEIDAEIDALGFLYERNKEQCLNATKDRDVTRLAVECVKIKNRIEALKWVLEPK